MDRWLRVYGSSVGDLEVAAQKLSGFLGSPERHDSLYRGGDYYLWNLPMAEVILQHNRELENDLAEPDHPDTHLVLYVTAPRNGRDWDDLAITSGFSLLRVQ